MIGKNKEKDLIQLEDLVKREKLAGHIVHHFYYHLRTMYPLEFIHLAIKYNKTSIGHQYYIKEAIERINKIYNKMNDYTFKYPETDEGTKELENNIKKLQQRLLKQNKEN